MSWWSDYSQIPFLDHGRDKNGCDCWGLVRLIFLEQLGIKLPMLLDGYKNTKELKKIEDMIKASIGGFKQVKEIQPFDILVIRIKGRNSHVGLVVASNIVIHTQPRLGVITEDYTRPHLAPRVREIWRRTV